MTRDQIDTIRALFLENKSYQEIGDAVGYTKNAISGWISRQRKKDPEFWKMRVREAAKPKDRPTRLPMPIKTKPLPNTPKAFKASPGRPVAFLERSLGECAFPVEGEPGPAMLVCGGATRIDSTWCDYHRNVVFGMK